MIDHIEDLVNEKILKTGESAATRALAYAVEKENGARRFLLFLRPTASPGEIAHECKHMTNITFSWHGQHLSLTNDEHECYYLEELVDMAHRAINNYKKLYKIKKTALVLTPEIITFEST